MAKYNEKYDTWDTEVDGGKKYGTLTYHEPAMSAQTGNNHNNGPEGLGVTPGQSTMGSPTSRTMGSPTQQPPSGMMGMRQAFNDRGYNNDQIGYDDEGFVTLNGRRTTQRQPLNIDGTTYASEADINRAVNEDYAQRGDPLMAARQYVDAAHLGNIVDWDNVTGMVNIGGVSIKPTYVSDGIAYIPRSQLDNAIAAYRARTGNQTPKEVGDEWRNEWDTPTRRALNNVMDRQEFEYDPNNDPAFQQYMTEREREADLNYRKVLNANNTSVFGASGAVLGQAMAQRANALRDIADAQRDYRSDAYDRYRDDFDMRRQALNSLMGVSGDDYNKRYGERADAFNEARLERNDYNERRDKAWTQEQDAATNALLREGYSIANRQAAAQADMTDMYRDRYPEYISNELEGQRLANELSSINLSAEKQNYIWDKGMRNSFWTVNDARIVPELLELYQIGPDGITLVKKDGSPVNPQDFALDYKMREMALQYDKAYQAQRGRQDAKAGL